MLRYNQIQDFYRRIPDAEYFRIFPAKQQNNLLAAAQLQNLLPVRNSKFSIGKVSSTNRLQ